MRRSLTSKALSGPGVCPFCAFRPRPGYYPRISSQAAQFRQLHASSSRARLEAAVRRQSDDNEEKDFSMLRQNAKLLDAFPARTKPMPVSAPPATSQGMTDERTHNFQPSGSAHNGSKSREGSPRISFSVIKDRLSTHQSNNQEGRSLEQGNWIQTHRRGSGVGGDRIGSQDGRNSSQTQYRVPQMLGDKTTDQADARQYQPLIRRIELKDSDVNQHSRQTNDSIPPASWRQTAGKELRPPGNFRIQRVFAPDGEFSVQDSRYGSQRAQPNTRDRRTQAAFQYEQMSDSYKQKPFMQQQISNPTTSRSNGTKFNLDGRDTTGSIGEASEIDTVEAPAGSSFDSTFDADTRRRSSKDKRNRRSDRFEESDQDYGTSQPLSMQVKARATSRAFDFDAIEAEEMLYGEKGRRKKKSKISKQIDVSEPSRPTLRLPEFISVERLARLLKLNTDKFVEKLEEEGFEGARYDHVLDSGTSAMFADLYGFEPLVAGSGLVEDLIPRPPPEDPSVLPSRPPIVTIMGHVDHGKTTILDYLRKSSVVATEHGGITQHIGAFSVTMPGTHRQITFLDTPGHAAFLEMRRRGANVTDIVVLVVAADDSVKPQTVEAIKHALEAKVQVIVAINKVDKADADIERVKQDLTRHEIVVEDYGGDYQVIPVSGKTGQGMAELEEAIITLADVSDYRAETDGPAEGWVLESKVTSAGRVATVLVRRGTLRTGDFIVAGTTWARVRTLRNDAGALVSSAPPGTPVQVDGWRAGDPSAGLEVLQADNEDHAKEVVDLRLEQEGTAKAATNLAALNTTRTEDAEARAKVLAWEAEQAWAKKSWGLRPKDNAGWVETEKAGGLKEVPFVIKADVAGSVEAVVAAVVAIGNNEISAKVIHSGVGELTEFDIKRLASTGESGYAITFNQPVDGNIARLAAAANLHVLNHNIIYKVTDDVKDRLSSELPPVITQKVLGEAEVGQVFEVTVKKEKIKIAGCRVTNGTIARANKIRVIRKGETVYTGTLHSLKNVKKDVTEMRKGTECGMGFEAWEDFEEGDQVQCFEEHQEKRTLY